MKDAKILDTVVNLAMAQAEYQKACDDFAGCRCYTYYQMVLIASKRLLDASDAKAFAFNEFDAY